MDGWFEAREVVNPARAGMIRSGGGLLCEGRRKPRASGDDPTLNWTAAGLKG